MENKSVLRAFDRAIEFLLYLTVAVVPLVYYNNPIATEYFFSKAFFFDLFVYGAFCLLFLRGLLAGKLTLHWGTTFPALLAFCVVCLQSLIGATNVAKGLETMVRVGAAVPFMFLLFQKFSTRDGLQRFLITAAIANIGVTAYGFLQYYEVFPLPRDQYGTADPSTTIGLTNFVMEYMSVFMFVMPAMVIVERKRWAKALFVIASVFQYYYFLISDNRAAMLGWLSALPLLALLLFLQYRRGTFRFSKTTTATFAGALVLATALFAISPQGQRLFDRFQSIFKIGHFDDAITFRLETWKQTLIIFKENPLRGVGLSNLEVEFPRYMSPFLEQMTMKKNTRVTTVHNEYLQVLGDLGLLGGIVFAWFLVVLVRLGYRAYTQAKAWDDLLVVTGLLTGIASYLVIAFFAFPFEVPSSSLSIFLVIGLLEVMTNRILAPNAEGATLHVPVTWIAPAAGSATAAMLFMTLFSSLWMWRVLRAEVYFKESRVVREFNRWDVGKDLLDQAVRLYPQNEAYYYDRSIFSLQLGDVGAAFRDLEITAELVPNYAMGHKQLGLLAAQRGDYRRAAKEFELAYGVYRTYPDDYVPLIVRAHIGAGDLTAAVAAAEAGAQKAPTSAEIRLALGQAYLAAKRHEGAIAALRQALALRADLTEARGFLALALAEYGRYDEALKESEAIRDKAAALQQAQAAYYLARIKALAGLRRDEEARGVLAEAIAAAPHLKEQMRRDPDLAKLPALQPILAK